MQRDMVILNMSVFESYNLHPFRYRMRLIGSSVEETGDKY